MTQKKITKKSFTIDEIEDMGLPRWPVAGVKVVSDETIEHNRWTLTHRLIFRTDDMPENTAWCVYYDEPATEMQEGIERWTRNPVEAEMVRGVEKTVIEWITVVEEVDG